MKFNFTRITDGRKIIPEIEGLRFVSIALVVLSHIHNNTLRVYPQQLQHAANNHLATFLEQCGAGVNIFFFISGFILAIPFLQSYVHDEKKISLKHYYYRRLTRIEPPYIITLVFCWYVISFITNQSFAESIKHFLASAFYMHNVVYDHISTINPVAWTLEIEVQYYLLVPLIAALFFIKNNVARRTLLILLFLSSSCLYFQNFMFYEQHHLSKSILAYASIFIAGVIVADWYLSNKEYVSAQKSFLFDVLGLLSIYGIITMSGFPDFGYRLFLFSCYFMLFLSAFKGRLLNIFLTNKWITIIGGMCYSIYLLHFGITFFITQTFTKKDFTYNYTQDIFMQIVIITPLILIISALFFTFLERPFMNINWPIKLKKYLRRKFNNRYSLQLRTVKE